MTWKCCPNRKCCLTREELCDPEVLFDLEVWFDLEMLFDLEVLSEQEVLCDLDVLFDQVLSLTTIPGNVVHLLLGVKVCPTFVVTEMIFVAEAKGFS